MSPAGNDSPLHWDEHMKEKSASVWKEKFSQRALHVLEDFKVGLFYEAMIHMYMRLHLFVHTLSK